MCDTVLELLANLSKKLDRTLPALLIGSIINGVLQNHPTDIQIDLGVSARHSKTLINRLHDYGVSCTYDEVLRFKTSAALVAVHDTDLAGLSNAETGLIQVVADTFDADISSQNGKLSTHSLAVLVTQEHKHAEQTQGTQKIQRISKENMSEPIE